MLNYQPSIRQKITFGYFVIVAMIFGITMFTYLELRYVKQKITACGAISEFLETSIEIRRFEKNIFLYKEQSDYGEILQYVSRAQDILDRKRDSFLAVVSSDQIASTQAGLENYRRQIKLYAGTEKKYVTRRNILGGLIRIGGHELITSAENMSKAERKSLQQILSNHQRLLIIAIVFLSIVVIAVGQFFLRMVMKPLKSLEESMGNIAAGKFEHVTIDTKDREIVSLTNVINKMLKELQLHERQLIQSEKLASLGTLLSGVAHELNNPLSNISSSNQILMEELAEGLWSGDKGRGKEVNSGELNTNHSLEPSFIMELVHQIDGQTDRARNIIGSLLDFSRDQDFKKEMISLKKSVEETIQFVRGQIPAKIVVTLSIPDDIMIYADKQRIQQAFLNLVKNAVDAISSDEGTVTLKAEKRRALDDAGNLKNDAYHYLKYFDKCTLDQDTVDIEIRDSGSGIPLDIIPNIFDPFFTTKEVGKGSGLGLYVVHEIIEQHDGCIAVNSEPGKGTTFLIRLPLKENMNHARDLKTAYH